MISIGIKVCRRYYETYGLKKIKIVNQFLFFFTRRKVKYHLKKLKITDITVQHRKQVTLNR